MAVFKDAIDRDQKLTAAENASRPRKKRRFENDETLDHKRRRISTRSATKISLHDNEHTRIDSGLADASTKVCFSIRFIAS